MDWRDGWRIQADPATGFARAEVVEGQRCQYCHGIGRREVKIDGVWRVGKCRCQMVVDRVALFNAAGVPARQAHCALENFDVQVDGARVGWQITRTWLDNYRGDPQERGLLLSGKPGRGKTHLMVGAIRELVFRYGVAVKFIVFPHLISRMKEGIDRNDGAATTLTPFVQAEVLAIDELGAGRKTDWELAVIDEILTRRYNTGRRLLATTNFSWSPVHTQQGAGDAERRLSLAVGLHETLEERLGPRAMSRIRDTMVLGGVIGEEYRSLAKAAGRRA